MIRFKLRTATLVIYEWSVGQAILRTKSYLYQLLEVKGALGNIDKLGQSNGSQVAHSNLIRGSVLDNFRAQVGTSNRSQILLVRFLVAGVLDQM